MNGSKGLSIDEILYKNIASIITMVLVIGIGSIYFVEWLMTVKANNWVSTDYLSHLSDFFAPVGIVFSSATILLLYVNFKHQQKELKNLIKANNDAVLVNKELVEGNIRSNELQIINNEIKHFYEVCKVKQFQNDLDFFGFLDLVESECYDNKKDNHKYDAFMFLVKDNYRQIDYILSTIGRIDTLLHNNIKYLEYRPFLRSRLPYSIAGFVYLSKEYYRLNENVNNTGYDRTERMLKEFFSIIDKIGFLP